jgi:hypothetical protein
VLDQQYIVVNPDGAAGTRKRLGTVRIMLSLEKLQSVSNGNYSTGRQGGYAAEQQAQQLSQGGYNAAKGPEYTTAWELEMWKKAEEATWRAELADKEHVRLSAVYSQRLRVSDMLAGEDGIARSRMEKQRAAARSRGEWLLSIAVHSHSCCCTPLCCMKYDC